MIMENSSTIAQPNSSFQIELQLLFCSANQSAAFYLFTLFSDIFDTLLS
jgi:hypothetical protein